MKSIDFRALFKTIIVMIAGISAVWVVGYIYEGVYWLVKYIQGVDSFFAREKAICIFMMLFLIPMCVFSGYQCFKDDKPKRETR